MTNSDLKRCSNCRVEKPRDEFSPAPSNPDGLNYHCRECAAARSRAYRATPAGHAATRAAALRTRANYRARNIPGTAAA